MWEVVYLLYVYVYSIESIADYLGITSGSQCYVDSMPLDQCLHNGLTSGQNMRVANIVQSNCLTKDFMEMSAL